MPFEQIPKEVSKRPSGELAKFLADAGVNGDSEVGMFGDTPAHLTPGELVVPTGVKNDPQNEQVMMQLFDAFRRSGMDPSRYLVRDTGGEQVQQFDGPTAAPANDVTGMQQFYDDGTGNENGGTSGGQSDQSESNAGSQSDASSSADSPGDVGGADGSDPDARDAVATAQSNADPIGRALNEAFGFDQNHGYGGQAPGVGPDGTYNPGRPAVGFGDVPGLGGLSAASKSLVDAYGLANVKGIDDVAVATMVDSFHNNQPTAAQAAMNANLSGSFTEANPGISGMVDGLATAASALPGVGTIVGASNFASGLAGSPGVGYGPGIANRAGRGVADEFGGITDIGIASSNPAGGGEAGEGPAGEYISQPGDPIVVDPSATTVAEDALPASYRMRSVLNSPIVSRALSGWPSAGPQVNPATGAQMFANESNFDADWYSQQNQDVVDAGMDPWEHYQQFGKSEGRLGNTQENAAREEEGYEGEFGGGAYSAWQQQQAQDRGYLDGSGNLRSDLTGGSVTGLTAGSLDDLDRRDEGRERGFSGDWGSGAYNAFLGNYQDDEPSNPHNTWTARSESNVDRTGMDASASRNALRNAGYNNGWGSGGANSWLQEQADLRGIQLTGDTIRDAEAIRRTPIPNTRPSGDDAFNFSDWLSGSNGGNFYDMLRNGLVNSSGGFRRAPQNDSGYVSSSGLSPYRGMSRFAAPQRVRDYRETLGFAA